MNACCSDNTPGPGRSECRSRGSCSRPSVSAFSSGLPETARRPCETDEVVTATIAKSSRPTPDPQTELRRERWLVGGVMVLTLFAAWLRMAGLSSGSFYRDDAWVALTHRVPWHVAIHMVGTAPGFVLFERFWTSLTAPSTWWAQLPSFAVSILAI